MPPSRDGKEMEDAILSAALGGNDRSVLFKVVRTDLRAAYGFNAGVGSFTRDIRVLSMRGEVETAKLAETELAVRKAYAEYLLSGPSGDLGLWKAPFAENSDKLKQSPDSLASTALSSMLDNQPASRSLNLGNELKAVTAETLNARLKQAFPKPDGFLMIAISPDANALPGACVVESIQEVSKCQ